MSVFQMTSQISPPLPAWALVGNRWVAVQVTEILHQGAAVKNTIVLADGTTKTVNNADLRFGAQPAAAGGDGPTETYRAD